MLKLTKKEFDDLTVLIVNEISFLQCLHTEILFSIGVRNIIEVRDGSEAVREIHGSQCDLIITGLEMSPMDGLHLTKYIRTSAVAPNKQVPIIMVAQIEEDLANDARNIGINELISIGAMSFRNFHTRIVQSIKAPRPFIDIPGTYIGPCRRRGAKDYYTEADRRVDEYIKPATKWGNVR